MVAQGYCRLLLDYWWYPRTTVHSRLMWKNVTFSAFKNEIKKKKGGGWSGGGQKERDRQRETGRAREKKKKKEQTEEKGQYCFSECPYSQSSAVFNAGSYTVLLRQMWKTKICSLFSCELTFCCFQYPKPPQSCYIYVQIILCGICAQNNSLCHMML